MSQQDTPHQSHRKTSYIKKSLQNQLGPIHFCCESMICLIQSQNEHISYVLFFKQEKRNHELQQNKFPGTKDTMKCSAKIDNDFQLNIAFHCKDRHFFSLTTKMFPPNHETRKVNIFHVNSQPVK